MDNQKMFVPSNSQGLSVSTQPAGSMLGATLSRVRGGFVSKASIRSATVPVSMAGGRAMSVWSEMPMGPPDPILGLTGTICD